MHTHTVGIGVMISAHTLQVRVEYLTLVLVLTPKPNSIGADTRYWYRCVPTLKVPYFSQCSIIIKWACRGTHQKQQQKKPHFCLQYVINCVQQNTAMEVAPLWCHGGLWSLGLCQHIRRFIAFSSGIWNVSGFFLLKGTLEKTDSLSALMKTTECIYHQLWKLVHGGRSLKAKFTETEKNDFDASRRGWSATAVNLLFVQFSSVDRCAPGEKPSSAAWQLGLFSAARPDSFKNAAECRYDSEPNRVPSGNWKKIYKKKNDSMKQTSWQGRVYNAASAWSHTAWLNQHSQAIEILPSMAWLVTM